MVSSQAENAPAGSPTRPAWRRHFKLWAGLILFAVLAVLSPRLSEYACLNRTYLALTKAALQADGAAPVRPAGCRSDSSPLLAGPRGALRKLQIALAFDGLPAAGGALDGQPQDSAPVQLAYLLLGNVYLNAGEDQEALEAYRRGAAIAQLVQAGNAARDTGNTSLAISYWRAARSVWSKTGLRNKNEKILAISALENLADQWIGARDFASAAEAFAEKSRILEEPDLQSELRAGMLFERAGDLQNAQKWYETARAHFPSNEEPYIGLGDLAAKQGNWKEAITDYSIGVRNAPQSAAAWYRLGEAQFNDGNFVEACKALRQVQQISATYSGLQQLYQAAHCAAQ